MFRRTWFALAFSAVLAAPLVLAASKEEAAVLEAEHGWSKGVAANDYALLDKYLADDLTYTHSSGASDTKQSYIGKLKAGTMRYYSADYDGEVRVQLLGQDTALTFGKVKVVTLGPNGAQVPATLSFLHAFVKRGGHWQLVAHHSSKVN
jgi:ketosteroid isomerase-like protein